MCYQHRPRLEASVAIATISTICIYYLLTDDVSLLTFFLIMHQIGLQPPSVPWLA